MKEGEISTQGKVDASESFTVPVFREVKPEVPEYDNEPSGNPSS